jgi:hypothetical protein
MILDIETLVELVVARALVDKTAPDPGNLRNGWRTDALLIGDVDALVVIGLKNPGAYAEIGRGVLARVWGLPEMEMLAKIAIFRGERLLPLNANREQGLVQVAEELRTAIDALPDGPRKMRLSSLLSYNVGVFCDACGQFVLAAKMQERSAKEAEGFGDKAGAAIGFFMHEFYLLKDALCKDEAARASVQFSAMGSAFATAVDALRGTPLQVQWAEGNCPIHMIEACIWIGQTHKDWDNWVRTALAACDKLKWDSAALFMRAANLASHGDIPAEWHLINDYLARVIDSDVGLEIKATALLLAARIAKGRGDMDVAAKNVGRIPKNGAQHVLAVAQRLISK